MTEQPGTPPRGTAFRARLQRYGLLLMAGLLLLLVLLPVVGIAVFALFWVLIGVGAGAVILLYLTKWRRGPWRRR